MDNDTRHLIARADSIVRAFRSRDAEAAIMRSVRSDDFQAIAPDMFADEMSGLMVANRIDTMAQDFVASCSALPSFNCTPSNSLRDNAKKFAAKRTQIANSYVEYSRLGAQMPDAVDGYQSFGLIAFEVCADMDERRPYIKALDGSQVYPIWDSYLCTKEAVVSSWSNEWTLAALFPNAFSEAANRLNPIKGDRIKVMKYFTRSQVLVWLPEHGNTILQSYSNKLGRCPIVAVPRPSGKGDWHSIPKGAYGHLVEPLLAENYLRLLTLQATEQAVSAPMAVPLDVQDVPYGPNAVIPSNNPQGIQRVRWDVPTAGIQMSEMIDRDIQVGGMSPSSRTGNINASVITGRGVDALGEGYSAQIQMAHGRIGFALKQAIEMCFEMDEMYWPDFEKEIRGQESNTAYRTTYIPRKDIAGDYSNVVDYGFLLGMDPNRALIFVLQGQAAGLISTDTAQRNLPGLNINLTEETSKIQAEQLRGSLIQALAGIAQAAPQLIAAGQDPSALIGKYTQVLEGIKKGKEIEAIAAEVFAPPPPQPAPGESAPPGAPGSEQAGGGMPGQDSGLNPTIATEGQNGRPDISQLFAGITSRGQANLSGTVSRMNPVAGQ